MITRRLALQAGLALPAAIDLRAAAEPWTPEWDRTIITAALAASDRAFDPAESMTSRKLGPDYNYHSGLRDRIVHPTRESLVYALLLLEAGGQERAERGSRIIERVLSIQDTDPSSKWYGIWGYYLEEPPPKMQPADWNWADFNGSTLLLIAYRHGRGLAPALLDKVRTGILHAARSVERRNVSMSYTNIAIQGTFVTLAAAQLLEDVALAKYAAARLRRFAANLDLSGSFNEYNSPTYANVSIVNLTRIRMMVKDPTALELSDKIHARAWLHLGTHWHANTAQLAGPMSRCYSTDIGSPLWLQKALNNQLMFAGRTELPKVGGAAEVAVHDYRCPSSIAPMFLGPGDPRQHREVFVMPGKAPDVVHNRGGVAPIQGTTWLQPEFCLGSANRADFWIQRRPLLAYWGGRDRPARFVQLRFIKDDYDFSSALFYSVQEKNCILGLVTFRTPGGDKHVSLDPVRNGEFTASRLRLCLDIAGAPANAKLLSAASRVTVDLGGAKLWFGIGAAQFGKDKPALSAAAERDRLVISLDLIPPGTQQTVRLTDIGLAYAVFTLAMSGPRGSLEDFDRRCRKAEFKSAGETFEWRSPAGVLALTGSLTPKAVAEQDAAFSERLNGEPVPYVRLSEEKLA